MSNHWTTEQCAAQALAIRQWRPREKSTGAKAKAGKSRARYNSARHGKRNSECERMLKAVAGLFASVDATLLEVEGE
ncbi:MAG: hypothetical protein ABI155_02465 [Paralcaligenes sp.]